MKLGAGGVVTVTILLYLAVFLTSINPTATATSSAMAESLMDKFRRGAQKASIQATAFVRDSSTKVATSSRDFSHGFSLPGEAEKAAKILDSFLGEFETIEK